MILCETFNCVIAHCFTIVGMLVLCPLSRHVENLELLDITWKVGIVGYLFVFFLFVLNKINAHFIFSLFFLAWFFGTISYYTNFFIIPNSIYKNFWYDSSNRFDVLYFWYGTRYNKYGTVLYQIHPNRFINGIKCIKRWIAAHHVFY